MATLSITSNVLAAIKEPPGRHYCPGSIHRRLSFRLLCWYITAATPQQEGAELINPVARSTARSLMFWQKRRNHDRFVPTGVGVYSERKVPDQQKVLEGFGPSEVGAGGHVTHGVLNHLRSEPCCHPLDDWRAVARCLRGWWTADRLMYDLQLPPTPHPHPPGSGRQVC